MKTKHYIIIAVALLIIAIFFYMPAKETTEYDKQFKAYATKGVKRTPFIKRCFLYWADFFRNLDLKHIVKVQENSQPLYGCGTVDMYWKSRKIFDKYNPEASKNEHNQNVYVIQQNIIESLKEMVQNIPTL